MLPTDFHVTPSPEFSPPLISQSYSEARHLLRHLLRAANLVAAELDARERSRSRGVRGRLGRASHASSLRNPKRPRRVRVRR